MGYNHSFAKLSNLQGLRFYAFMLIFLNHSYGYLGISKVFDFGARGVEIFFVLSGFLVAYNYADKDLDSSLKGSLIYMLRKVKKFYVLHIITFVCFFITPLRHFINGSMSVQETNKFMLDTVLNITLLKSWYFPSAFSFNGVTWFLSTILLAYLLVPKLVAVFKNKSAVYCVISFLVLICVKFILDTYGYRFPHHFKAFSLYTNPAYRFMDFLLGYIFYTAISRSHSLNNEKSKGFLALIIPLAYIGTCFIFDRIWLPAEYLLLTLLLVYILTVRNDVIEFAFVVALGNISFELYILHSVVLKYMPKLSNILHITNHKILSWMIALFVTIAISFIVNKKLWKNLIRE